MIRNENDDLYYSVEEVDEMFVTLFVAMDILRFDFQEYIEGTEKKLC